MTEVAERPWTGPAPVSPRADSHMVKVRDGVRLATDVYVPEAGGPWPTILARVPYDKSGLYTGMAEIAAGYNRAGDHAAVLRVWDGEGIVRPGPNTQLRTV